MTTPPIPSKHDLEQQFINALSRQGVAITTASEMLTAVKAHHNLPVRYYHTLEHAQDVARHVVAQKQFASNLDALLLAAWFHDVVYSPMSDINDELASSRFARHTLYLAGCAVDFCNLVGDLIMCTQHKSRPDSIDGRILADADLVSLAAARPQYIINIQNIRKEYLHIPLVDFCKGHQQLMRQLQQRGHIFWTDHMAEQYETAARSNIDWIINCITDKCSNLFTQ